MIVVQWSRVQSESHVRESIALLQIVDVAHNYLWEDSPNFMEDSYPENAYGFTSSLIPRHHRNTSIFSIVAAEVMSGFVPHYHHPHC